MAGGQHTAGEWGGRVQYDRFRDEVQASNRAVALVWVRREVGVLTEDRQLIADPEGEANFSLISAAPDLLEAAEGLLKAYRALIDRLADDEFDMAADHPASWANKTEAAIAKARPTPSEAE